MKRTTTFSVAGVTANMVLEDLWFWEPMER